MKKWMLFLLIAALLVGCSPQKSVEPTLDTNLLYTQAAGTVAAQLTAEYTPPPTETPIPTPEPTATETVVPTPTTAPTLPWTYNEPGKVIAPILIYTHIADDVDDNPYYQHESPLNISSDMFREQMTALKQAGYTTIPVSLLVEALRNGAELPAKPVVITFEGGTIGIYTKAFPIMQELGLVGSVFMVANHVDGNGTLSTSQLKELIAAGWDVGSKGMNSVDLVEKPNKMSEEISGSKLKLEEKLGVPITVFSYPYGRVDGAVATRVSEWGYLGAVGIFKSTEHTLNTLYYLARYEIRNDFTMADFMTIFE